MIEPVTESEQDYSFHGGLDLLDVLDEEFEEVIDWRDDGLLYGWGMEDGVGLLGDV